MTVPAVVLAVLTGCAGTPADKPESSTAGPARAYVEPVNGKDLEALVAAFIEEGEVVDVTRWIKGPDAVRMWASDEVIGGALWVLEVTTTVVGQDLLVRWALQETALAPIRKAAARALRLNLCARSCDRTPRVTGPGCDGVERAGGGWVSAAG